MKAENTIEYWVYQASKGANIAECWQECKRISNKKQTKLKQCAKLIDIIHKQLDILDAEVNLNTPAQKAFSLADSMLNRLSGKLLESTLKD